MQNKKGVCSLYLDQGNGSKFYVQVKEPVEKEWLRVQVKSGDLKGIGFLCERSKSHFWEFFCKIWVMITTLPSTQPCMKDPNIEDQTGSLSMAEYLLLANLRLACLTLGKTSIMVSLRDQ